MPEMQAIEDRKDILKAIAHWSSTFAIDARQESSLGGTALCHKNEGVWGVFRPMRDRDTRSFYNAFGLLPSIGHSHVLLETNPPREGKDLRRKAVIAIDEQDHRWILHRGQLQVARTWIDPDTFIRTSGREPVHVRFSQGEPVPFLTVADIDAPPRKMLKQAAGYINDCARLRRNILRDDEADGIEEGSIKPAGREPEGFSERSAIDETIIYYRHKIIAAELKRMLKERGVETTNGSYKKLTPDLWSQHRAGLLFEIKSSHQAGSVEQGVGQLFIYQEMLASQLGPSCRKVLVIPRGSRSSILEVVRRLRILVLQFDWTETSVAFHPDEIDELVQI